MNDITTYQLINSLQNTLITIQVALKNKTMSHEVAQKHVKLVLNTANSIAKDNDMAHLINAINSIANDLLKSAEIQLPGYER